jgi:PTS system nitrogen regulatory IIA component
MEIVKKEASSSEVEPERLLTVRDVAKWFKVHEKTVYEWAERGKLPFIRLGKRLRFQADDILQWLASRKVN